MQPLSPDRRGSVPVTELDCSEMTVRRDGSEPHRSPLTWAPRLGFAATEGERVAAIVSESTLAMSQLLAALLTSEVAASALPAVLPAAFPWARSLPDDHLEAFAGELREAVVAESPERMQRVLDDWQAVAEVRAGERST